MSGGTPSLHRYKNGVSPLLHKNPNKIKNKLLTKLTALPEFSEEPKFRRSKRLLLLLLPLESPGTVVFAALLFLFLSVSLVTYLLLVVGVDEVMSLRLSADEVVACFVDVCRSGLNGGVDRRSGRSGG